MVSPIHEIPDPHLAREARDRAWAVRIRTGDTAAFEALFYAYFQPLCDFVSTYVEAADAAEELVQDLFCKLWDQRYEWEISGSVKSYLYKSARNRAFNYLRRRRVEEAFQARQAVLQGSIDEGKAHVLPDDQVEANELGRALENAVAQLPPRCREVFTLHRDQQLTYSEIAHVLEISVKTVEIHMARALVALRQRLAAWRD
jgi:RNA polymerase sigma-70 factor (ECF subfamily)